MSRQDSTGLLASAPRTDLRIDEGETLVLPSGLAPLWRYWTSLPSRSGLIPAKSALRMPDMKALLPGLVICERTASDYINIRLAGSTMEEMIGESLTGRNIFDLSPPDQREDIATVYDMLFGMPCGFYICETIKLKGDRNAGLDALVLPLADDNGEARFAVGYYMLSRRGYELSRKSRDTIEHFDISRFGYVDLGAGLPD